MAELDAKTGDEEWKCQHVGQRWQTQEVLNVTMDVPVKVLQEEAEEVVVEWQADAPPPEPPSQSLHTGETKTC